jgi:hypothetical protein
MTPTVAKFLNIIALICISACPLFARDPKVPNPPPPSPADVGFGGLQTSLTTGGLRFVVIDAPTVTPVPGSPVAVPDTFPACVSVQNRSPFEINFTFPNPAAAALKFTFRIFDSAGTLIWQSDGEIVVPPVETTEVLGKFQRWKRTLAIPLKPNGKALPAGIYTLEASTSADKRLGASTIFEVAPVAPPTDSPKLGSR